MPSRIYYQGPLEVGIKLLLPAPACQHLRQVLRLKSGEAFILFNGTGVDFNAQLILTGRNKAEALIQNTLPQQSKSAFTLNIACAIIKNNAMDFLLQKATELGVEKITPLLTDFCTIKQNKTILEKKQQHWLNICISAAEQCGRSYIPQLEPIQTLNYWLDTEPNSSRILLHQAGDRKFSDKPIKNNQITLISGPEGGFSNKELIKFKQLDYPKMRIGDYILRAETAPLAGLALCHYLLL